jgi:hypothetical protein
VPILLAEESPGKEIKQLLFRSQEMDAWLKSLMQGVHLL